MTSEQSTSGLYRAKNCRGRGRHTHLHVDEECYRLERTNRYRPVEREWFSDAPLCDHCGVRIVLVQCTGSKRDEPAPARDLYDESDLFVKQRGYATAVAPDDWFVQSAKHGLVEPETALEPYDVHASDLWYPSGWAESIAVDLAEMYDEGLVEILGGRAYADPLVPELKRRGFAVYEPLKGQRIGTRKRTLLEMTNESLEGFA